MVQLIHKINEGRDSSMNYQIYNETETKIIQKLKRKSRGVISFLSSMIFLTLFFILAFQIFFTFLERKLCELHNNYLRTFNSQV